MPETTKKSKKRDSLIDQIGQPKEQGVSASNVDALTDKFAAKTNSAEQLSDKEIAQLIEKKNKGGRPTKYSIELASEICELLADGNPLRRICKMDGMPNASSVYLWLIQHKEFSEMYARAREDQADALADEVVEIADEQPELVQVYDKDGKLVEVKIDSALLAWQRNRMDARKWTAAKLKPRKYGERQILAGDAESPLEVKQNSPLLDAFMEAALLERQSKIKG